MLSRPHFCISGTPIHPSNYPEELGAIRELGRVHGFSTLASRHPPEGAMSALQKQLNNMVEVTFLEVRLVEGYFNESNRHIYCQKSYLNAPEFHYSAYHFQHCGVRVRAAAWGSWPNG